MAIFELFRISLSKKKYIQGELQYGSSVSKTTIDKTDLENYDGESQEKTRKAYISNIFGKKITFDHRGEEYHYLPCTQELVNFPIGSTIFGKIGKPFEQTENLSPEEDFKEVTHNGWRSIIIVIDPTDHDDGQKISIQSDKKVGNPMAIIKSLASHINTIEKQSDYHLEIEPIFSPKTFWDFIEKNKEGITSIKFDFVAPNMFGTNDEINNALRDFRDKEKAEKINIEISSSNCLDTDTDKIKSGVEYAQKGCGEIIAKAKNGKRYSSKHRNERITIDDAIDSNTLLQKIAKKISSVFGRNE